MNRLFQNALAPLVLRLGLAVVFVYHGMSKIGPVGSWGVGWSEKAGEELSTFLEVLIAWGELIAGVSLAIGFLTRVAALGALALAVRQLVVLHGSNGFVLINKDGKMGYEFDFVVIVLALGAFLLGSGLLGLDALLFPRDPEPGS